MKKFIAFTLCEVLIVLGVLGIVAEMTIPTLAANTQKVQFLTGLKKAYTEWNQVLMQISADKGSTGDLAGTGLFADGTTHKTLGDEFVKYFKVVKNCTNATAGCFTDAVSNFYNGTGGRYSMDVWYYRFITADGMAFAIYNQSSPDDAGPNCNSNFSVSGSGALSQYCGDMYVDVNGPTKGPNNFGRDIFQFYFTNGKGPMLYPTGGDDDNWDFPWYDAAGHTPLFCYPGNPNGIFCTGRIMEEGWQMTY